MKNYILLFFLAFSLSCTQKKTETPHISDKNQNSDSNNSFKKLLAELIARYPANYHDNLPPVESNEFHLLRSDFIPNLDSLKFDLWGVQKCSGCWLYQFLHIYNQGQDFIVPLTDDRIYWNQSGKKPKENSEGKLNFEIELNRFVRGIQIKDRHKLELIIDEIMMLNNSPRINRTDLPKLKLIAEDLKKNESQGDSCRLNLEKSLKLTSDWLEKNKLAYSNGINVFLLDILENQSIKITSLNTNCNFSIIF